MGKITADQFDAMLEVIDNMPHNHEYYLTIEDIKSHGADVNFTEEKYAAFLLWLQESIPTQHATEAEKEASAYITQLFQQNMEEV